MPTPGKLVTDTGKVINMDQAYRKLTNAALSRSSGSLSHLPKQLSSRERGDNEDSSPDPANSRLQKDGYDKGEDGFIGDHSSEEDIDDTTSGEEDWTADIRRGRHRSRKKTDSSLLPNENGVKGKTTETKQVQSLLAAAEEERTLM
jgi:hypothetical protein